MGNLFRSEEMQLAQMYLQQEAAFSCVIELGELGLVEFKDLNPNVNAFQKKFVNEVRRCDEMERKLRFFEKEIKKDGMPIIDVDENLEAPQLKEMIDLEMTFEKLEKEVKVVNKNAEELNRTFLNLAELKSMLKKTQQFFNETGTAVQIRQRRFSDVQELNLAMNNYMLTEQSRSTNDLRFVSGVILRDRLHAFERMLWRVCRGNVFLRQAEIEDALKDPISGDQVYKSVFIIFFQGEQLKTRVKKVCEGFHATLYPCPESQNERREMISGVVTRIEDLKTVLSQTIEHRRLILIAAAKNIKSWFVKVRKLKSIYLCLNMFNFDVTSKCLIAECWYPTQDKSKITLALKRGTERSGASVNSILSTMQTKKEPPTFHRTNKFTEGFQILVDAYGVAKYREVNPAPFSIISFPFLFAVMFGDAGHGFIIFLAALALILKEDQIKRKRIQNEIFNIFFSGRYLVLLMGIFSVYIGLLYNDVFAKSLNIFGSAWKIETLPNDLNKLDIVQLNPKDQYDNEPYIFGIDPVWQLSKNKILFLNSYKMKLSVILGFFQMMFGIILSFWNHSYFKNKINLFCQFIPEIIFLVCIFGYMNILIFYKWLIFDVYSSGIAPNILIVLINMFLFKYKEKKGDVKTFFFEKRYIQMTLMFIAFICIPWMLFVKPFLLWKNHKKNIDKKCYVNYNSNTNCTSDVNDTDQISITVDQNSLVGGYEDNESLELEEFNFGNIFTNQAIHTIEYCLGSVSHTASYLRLWALSLAHAQLSEVLWNMIMCKGFSPHLNFLGGFFMVIWFAFWAILTIAILVLMEGMSAFLHTLRLHWVEFNSKFYIGTGHIFKPFSFKNMLEIEEATD